MAGAENEMEAVLAITGSGNGNENSQALELAAGDGYQKGHTGYTGGMYQLAQLQDYDFLIKHFYTSILPPQPDGRKWTQQFSQEWICP